MACGLDHSDVFFVLLDSLPESIKSASDPLSEYLSPLIVFPRVWEIILYDMDMLFVIVIGILLQVC